MHELGIDFERELRVFESFRRRLDERVRSLPEPARRQAVLTMLAATSAAEHFTATLSWWASFFPQSWVKRTPTTTDPGSQVVTALLPLSTRPRLIPDSPRRNRNQWASADTGNRTCLVRRICVWV